MKKVISLIILLVVCFSTSAWTSLDSSPQEELLQTYSNRASLPFDIKLLDDKNEFEEYAFLLMDYAGSDKAIAVGTLNNYDNIYTSPDNGDIFDIYVNNIAQQKFVQ